MNRIAIAADHGRLAAYMITGALGLTAAVSPLSSWAASRTADADLAATAAESSPGEPAGPGAADAGSQVAEVVVTARRTEEKLRDVPVAVTALSPEALKEQRIGSQSDLQFATPGLIVRETGSSDQLNYSLRGQSIDAFS